MTVIIYDSRTQTLLSDSCVSLINDSSPVYFTSDKLKYIVNAKKDIVLAGFAGNIANIVTDFNSICAQLLSKQAVTIPDTSAQGTSALVLHYKKSGQFSIYLHTSGSHLLKLIPNTPNGDYLYAEGAGATAAMAAMFAGATILEAAYISQRLDSTVREPFFWHNVKDLF